MWCNQSEKLKPKAMKIEDAKKNFPIGQVVSMKVDGDWIDGKTIESVCKSPTANDPDRLVVSIKWDDKSTSIENIKDLSPQPNLSFLSI